MGAKDFSDELLQNTVPSNEQLRFENFVFVDCDETAEIRVLFVGNSITRHAPKSDIGWYGDWGMAASSLDKDYVHRILQNLQIKYNKVGHCIAQLAEWERNFWKKEEVLNNYEVARDFEADVIVVRLGENVDGCGIKEYSFEEEYDYMVNYFNKHHKAKVILTTLFWKADVIDNQIRNVARKRGYYLSELGDLGEKSEMKAIGLFAHQGVAIHPNDLGMNEIAERILIHINSM